MSYRNFESCNGAQEVKGRATHDFGSGLTANVSRF